ncbi:MAG: class I SAM-dependent methyltransferase [Anaerolineales bacterium]
MLRKLKFEAMYLKHPRWDTGITPPELVDFVNNRNPAHALELGCGSGTNAMFLAQHGWQVVAVDFSHLAIFKAKQKSYHLNLPIKWICHDVSNLTLNNMTFDLILDIGCFHGLTPQQKQRYRTQLKSYLAENGTFLLYGFLNSVSHEVAVTDYDIAEFKKFLFLEEYKIGTDGNRQSAWFTFINTSSHQD